MLTCDLSSICLSTVVSTKILGNKWNSDKFISYKKMLHLISNTYPVIDKSFDDPNDTTKVSSLLLIQHYKIPGFKGRFGFITSMSDHFCGTCNRLRILADGNMKVCLFGNSEVNLRKMLREDQISDDELVDIISATGN